MHGQITWVDCAADDSAERIPCHVIEPVVKAVIAFGCQEACCAVVEIRIELVNNRLIAQHGKQSR